MSLKETIRGHLQNKEFDQLVELAAREKQTIKYLTSFLYSEDDLLHWRAADALGIIAAHREVVSTDKLRSVIDRLFVNLNDQSGGNAWGAVEAIGAIIAARPREFSGLIDKMFSYISDGRIRKGLLWSVRKIGLERPDFFEDKVFHVVGLLRNPSNTTRGHAAWALGAIGYTDIRVIETLIVDIKETLRALQDDDSRIRVYDDGELREVTVGELAEESLESIDKRRPKA